MSAAAAQPAASPALLLQHVLDGADQLAIDADQVGIFGQRQRLTLVLRDSTALQDHPAVGGEKDRLGDAVVAVLPDQLHAEVQGHRSYPSVLEFRGFILVSAHRRGSYARPSRQSSWSARRCCPT